MAINFPSSPVDGQTLTVGKTVYAYSSAKGVWNLQTSELLIPTSPNYIINGAFDIWQRGVIFGGTNTYCADRWLQTRSGLTALNVTRSTDVPTGQPLEYSALMETSGLNTLAQLEQRIEAASAHQIAGQTVTFSIWAKNGSGTAGNSTLTWSSAYPTPDDDIWTTSVSDQSGTFAATFTSGTWVRYSATFTANALATRGYRILVKRTLTANESTSTYLTGAQLELGSVATPFRRNAPSIQAELAACQRYYVRFTGSATTDVTYFGHGFGYDASNARFGIPLPTTMRVTPTSIAYNNLRAYNGSNGINGNTNITLYTAGSRPTLLSVNLADSSVSTGVHYALEGAGSGTVPYLAADAEL